MPGSQVWTPEISSFIKICYTELVLTHEQVSELVRHVYGWRFEEAKRKPGEPTAETVMGHYKWRYSKGRPVYWPRIDPANGQITVEGYNLLEKVRPMVHQALADLRISCIVRTTTAFPDGWAIVGPQPAPSGVVMPPNVTDTAKFSTPAIAAATLRSHAPRQPMFPPDVQLLRMVTRSRSTMDPTLIPDHKDARSVPAYKGRSNPARPFIVREEKSQATRRKRTRQRRPDTANSTPVISQGDKSNNDDILDDDTSLQDVQKPLSLHSRLATCFKERDTEGRNLEELFPEFFR